jgi:hypothetical protein
MTQIFSQKNSSDDTDFFTKNWGRDAALLTAGYCFANSSRLPCNAAYDLRLW